jgi:hypothetical protein
MRRLTANAIETDAHYDRRAIAASLRDFDKGERGVLAAETVLAVRAKLGLVPINLSAS